MIHRFFLPAEAFQKERIVFPGETARQIERVLRLREGDHVIVLNGRGDEYVARLSLGDVVSGEILNRQQAAGEPMVSAWLYLSLSQREKVEWVLQKGTELGCAGFIPIVTSRTLVQDASAVEKKRARWETILREAAEQSGRGKIPQLARVFPFAQALGDGQQRCELVCLPDTGHEYPSLQSVVKQVKPQSVAIFIGPEGGFSPEEVALALESGVYCVTLGPRVLRMETAALAALTLTMCGLGEMGTD
ncbi:MAG: 16S rRNA (uracil(1498)-N(3))-methyltransferase [Anaerolineae bacterium]|nr:16S rRNA (uracil(1498)-N(3))-methyltransferase [Anaerolineae bacterium]